MSDSEESSPSPARAPPDDPSISASERIAELNAIDADITTLLSSASSAIGILANSPSSNTQQSALRNESSAREAFTTAASTFFSTLSSIEVRLKRNVYALEEAGLIRPGDKSDERRGASTSAGVSGEGRVGGGSLDPSWLNARAHDSVEIAKRAELLEKAREFVERIETEEKSTVGGKASAERADDSDDDVEMG